MPRAWLDIARIACVCVLALGVFGIGVAVDVSANAGVGFFYTVPVGLAAWWGGWRAGAATTLGCCGLYAIGDLIQPIPDFEVALAVRAVAFTGVTVLVSVIRRRMVSLERSVEELETIRAALTPERLLDLPHLDAAAAFVPSEHGVSGDFYLLTNNRDGSTVAIVGDVVGHGPDAARLATFLRARFAAFAANTSDPAELLTLANTALIDRSGTDPERVSAVCLRFGSDGTGLSWAIAGHPPPLRLPALLELEREGPTLLLGESEEFEIETGTTQLEVGDGVLAYTDGATDVRQGDLLLGFEGLLRLVAPLAGLPASALVARAEDAILRWSDGRIRDDLCVLVMRPKSLEPG